MQIAKHTWAIMFLLLEFLSIAAAVWSWKGSKFAIPFFMAIVLALLSPHSYQATFFALISPLATACAVAGKQNIRRAASELILFVSFPGSIFCIYEMHNQKGLATLAFILLLANRYVARGFSVSWATGLALAPIVGLAGFLYYL